MDNSNMRYTACFDLGGIVTKICCYSEETILFFKQYIPEVDSDDPMMIIDADDINWEGVSRKQLRSDPETEFTYFLVPVGNALLSHNRCVFHGTAFLWNGKAYIFTGPSGAGKSTQYKNWRSLYRGEVKIINGDKPIIEKRDTGEFFVHPSPWRGKEGFGSLDSAKLSGFIYVEQAFGNKIQIIPPANSVEMIFRQIIHDSSTESLLKEASSMLNDLLMSVPVWKLECLADEDAVLLTRKAIEEYEAADKTEL